MVDEEHSLKLMQEWSMARKLQFCRKCHRDLPCKLDKAKNVFRYRCKRKNCKPSNYSACEGSKYLKAMKVNLRTFLQRFFIDYVDGTSSRASAFNDKSITELN